MQASAAVSRISKLVGSSAKARSKNLRALSKSSLSIHDRAWARSFADIWRFTASGRRGCLRMDGRWIHCSLYVMAWNLCLLVSSSFLEPSLSLRLLAHGDCHSNSRRDDNSWTHVRRCRRAAGRRHAIRRSRRKEIAEERAECTRDMRPRCLADAALRTPP